MYNDEEDVVFQVSTNILVDSDVGILSSRRTHSHVWCSDQTTPPMSDGKELMELDCFGNYPKEMDARADEFPLIKLWIVYGSTNEFSFVCNAKGKLVEPVVISYCIGRHYVVDTEVDPEDRVAYAFLVNANGSIDVFRYELIQKHSSRWPHSPKEYSYTVMLRDEYHFLTLDRLEKKKGRCKKVIPSCDVRVSAVKHARPLVQEAKAAEAERKLEQAEREAEWKRKVEERDAKLAAHGKHFLKKQMERDRVAKRVYSGLATGMVHAAETPSSDVPSNSAPQLGFQYLSQRNFECRGCGTEQSINKRRMGDYQCGFPLTLICDSCNARSQVTKSR